MTTVAAGRRVTQADAEFLDRVRVATHTRDGNTRAAGALEMRSQAG